MAVVARSNQLNCTTPHFPRTAARIEPDEEPQISALLRVGVVGAIPVLILLVGVLFRWLRG